MAPGIRQIAVVTLAGAAVALAGCANADPRPPAPQGGSSSSTSPAEGSAEQYADAQAAAMLKAFTPPPGARRASVSPSPRLDHVEESSTAIDKNLVDASAEWVAPGNPADVLAEAAKNVPAQYQRVGTGTSGNSVADDVWKLPKVPDLLNLRELDVSVVSAGNGATGIRVDALAGWVTSAQAQAHQWVPATARVMTLTGSFKPRPVSAVRAPATVTNAAQVADIVSVINGLSPLLAGAVYHCPADFGGEVMLTFRARVGGPVLAAVNLPQSGCGFVSVAQNGKQQQTSLLPADGATDVLWRIGRITGLDWATVQP